ncbi:MAG: LysR substrate-binding domain-containing protein, partial [Verrucomicrobiota bacterium]
VSQPAVSRQIRDLEDEFGLTLFNRKRDGMELTPDGQTALSHAREILRQANALTEAMNAIANVGEAKTLNIGYIPTALPGFLADGLRQFRQQQPDVCVQIYEMSPSEQERALREGEIDLALLGHPCTELQRSYRTKPIRKVPIAVALPETHRLANRKGIELAELAEETFLSLHEKQFPGRPELLRATFGKAGIAPRILLKVNGLSELLGQVGAGAGVALIPADVDVLPHHGVRFVDLRKPKVTLISSAVWRPDAESPQLLDLLDQIS